MPVITLTTDFGLADPFVGLMKGVIYSIAPDARIVDLSHGVSAGDVMGAALVLEAAVGYFPRWTIHVGVVDPGVGSQRKAIAVETAGGFYFVGPDNGLFSAALTLAPANRIVELTNSDYHLHPTSATFHGRDIFAPVAAHLAAGVGIEQLGPPVDAPTMIDLPAPRAIGDDTLELRIIHVDRFGNLITNLKVSAFAAWAFGGEMPDAAAPPQRQLQRSPPSVQIDVVGHVINGLHRTFSDVPAGQAVAYFGSGGRLEIAVRDGRASDVLGVKNGATLTLRRDR